MIQLSPTAIAEINRLRSKPHAPGSILRLRIQPGGCMDWYYDLSLCAKLLPGEHLIQQDHLQVAVDSASLERIENLVIDYSEDLMGGGFRFRNARAVQTCGCGSSFSVN